MRRSAALPFLVLLLGLLPLAGHEMGMLKLRFEELGDSRYRLSYVAAPGSPESQAPPTLPERGSWETVPGQPVGVVRLVFTTIDGAPLRAEDELLLPWSRESVMVESFWRSGESSRRFFRAGEGGIPVPVGDLRAGSGGFGEGAKRYLILGVEHILTGWDHLLFIICLLTIVRGVRVLVLAVTAFTVSHSIFLAVVTLGWSPLESGVVEALIALSIAFLAAEALRRQNGRSAGRYVAAAFGFGLLHGMGLAGALADLELPQADLPMALVFFNLGVELGQLSFILPVLLAAWGWQKFNLKGGEKLLAGAAGTAGVVAMFWFFERTLALFVT